MNFVYFRGQTENPDEPFFNYTEIIPAVSQASGNDTEEQRVQMKLDDEAEDALFATFMDNLSAYKDHLAYNVLPNKVAVDGLVHRRFILRIARGEPLERPQPEPAGPLIEDVTL